jgi:hypothetical protein
MEGLILAPPLGLDGASFDKLRKRLWESSMRELKPHPKPVEG